MIFLDTQSTDPFFNLAAEEYAVKHIKDEVFMLWSNDDCVVVGKHQNAVAEANIPFLNAQQIPLIRRISGGGTVFQGKGNINFGFIRNVSEGEDKVNFKRHLQPLISFLKHLGVEASIEGKSSLTINGLKISGNAAHLHRNRSLHHGTLLYDADLQRVNEAIRSRPERYHSKAVASNRVHITNLRPWLKNELTEDAFISSFRDFVFGNCSINQIQTLNAQSKQEVNKLVAEKYRTRAWNFGYSPDYEYEAKLNFENQLVHLWINVSRDRIIDCKSLNNSALTILIADSIRGLRPSIEELSHALSKALEIKNTTLTNQMAAELL